MGGRYERTNRTPAILSTEKLTFQSLTEKPRSRPVCQLLTFDLQVMQLLVKRRADRREIDRCTEEKEEAAAQLHGRHADAFRHCNFFVFKRGLMQRNSRVYTYVCLLGKIFY